MEQVNILVKQVNYEAEHVTFTADVNADDPVKALSNVVDPNTDFKVADDVNLTSASPSRSFDLPATPVGTPTRHRNLSVQENIDTVQDPLVLQLMSLNQVYNMGLRNSDAAPLPMVHAYVPTTPFDKMTFVRDSRRFTGSHGSIVSLDRGTSSARHKREVATGWRDVDAPQHKDMLVRRENGSASVVDQVAWESRVAGDVLETASNMSGCSSRFELESNCSDRAETMSTISTISGYEEEMFRIKKLLLMDTESSLPQKQRRTHKQLSPDSKRSSYPNNVVNGGTLDSLGNTGNSVAEIPRLKIQLQDALLAKEKYREALESSARTAMEWQDKYQESSRQRAHVEGQLETLKTELEFLQQKWASSESENKSNRTMEGKIVFQEMEMMTCEQARLQQLCREVQNKNQELALQLEFKDTTMAHMRSELQECEHANEKLHAQLRELQVELDAKDGAVQGLKTNIASLHVESQAHLQANMKANNTIVHLKGELESTQKSSQWYCNQLHACQEAKAKVQQELMTLQTNLMSQNHLVEKLKTEIQDLQCACEETRNRAVREKESLMRKLEVIQADILEREAMILSQIKHGEASETLATIAAKLNKTEEGKCQHVSNAQLTVKDLEQDIQSLKNELTSKNSKLETVEASNAELMVRVTTIQKTLNERELYVQNLENNHRTLESALSKERECLKDKNNLFHEMMAEKIDLEVALMTERKEKKEVDEAIEKLRTDFFNVSRNYQAMKADLRLKENHISNLEKQLKELQADRHNLLMKNEAGAVAERKAADLAEQQSALKETVCRLTQTLAVRDEQLASHSKTIELHEADIQRKEILVTQLENEKKQLEDNLNKNASLQAMSDYFFQFESPSEIIKELELARYLNQEQSEVRKKFKKEMRNSDSQTEAVSIEIINSSYKHQLHHEDCSCQTDLLPKQSSSKNTVETSDSFMHLCGLVVETKNMLDNAMGKCTEYVSSKLESVESLCAFLSIINKDLNKFVAASSCVSSIGSKRCDCIDVQVQGSARTGDGETGAEVQRLKATLQLLETEHREKQRRYELNVRTLLQEVKGQLRGRRAAEKRARDAGELRARVQTLEGELEDAAARYERLQGELLEMEKQRGRLEVAATNQAVSLPPPGESAAILELRARQLQLQHSQQRQAELEEELRKSSIIIKELRKEIFGEKCESSQLRKQVASLQLGLETANDELDNKKVELGRSEAMCEVVRAGSERLKRELEREQRAHEDARQTLEKLHASLQDSRAKDPVLADQIKMLGYHLHKKTQEAEALQQSKDLAEERWLTKEQSLLQDVAALRGEVAALQSELNTVHNDKFALQAQAAELRAALQCSLDSSRLLKAKLESFGCSEDKEKAGAGWSLPAPPARYDEARIAKLLAQSCVLPYNKPLSNLRSCLDSLKLEMVSLQEQISAKTATSSDKELGSVQQV